MANDVMRLVGRPIEERLPASERKHYPDYYDGDDPGEVLAGLMGCAIEIGGCYTCYGPVHVVYGHEPFKEAMEEYAKRAPGRTTMTGIDEDQPLPSANVCGFDEMLIVWDVFGRPELPKNATGTRCRAGGSDRAFRNWWKQRERQLAVEMWRQKQEFQKARAERAAQGKETDEDRASLKFEAQERYRDRLIASGVSAEEVDAFFAQMTVTQQVPQRTDL